MDLLTQLHENEKTVILITHDTHLIKSADRMVFLKDGEIIEIKRNHKKKK